MAVAVIGAIAWLAISRADLKAELAETRAAQASCLSANEEWAARAAIADKAARNLRMEAEARQATAAAAMKKAGREAERHEERARKIADAKPEGGECEAARKLLREYLQGRK